MKEREMGSGAPKLLAQFNYADIFTFGSVIVRAEDNPIRRN